MQHQKIMSSAYKSILSAYSKMCW